MTKCNLSLENSAHYKTQYERNYCDQIFSKETATTGVIHEKFEETEIEPNHTNICGLELTTKELWVFSGLLLIFFSSCLTVVSIFVNAMINGYVVTDPVTLNNSVSLQQWKGPNVTTLIKVYIFNYTNVEDYEKGKADKLHVEEIGPFVYEEFLTKINIKFHPNGTVSYQTQRTHKYRADLSNGKENEIVIVPNTFFMGAIAAIKQLNILSRMAMKNVLDLFNLKLFLNLPAHNLILGYYDNSCNMFNEYSIVLTEEKLPCEKNGLLTFRNGTSEDVVTVNTGKNNINKVGQIDNYNGQNKSRYWSTGECNKIQGSDGMLFPPDTIRQKNSVHVYFKELCRSFPMVYEQEVELPNGTVSAYKYVLPDTVFDLPKSNAENQCFCNTKSGSCSPKGLFNATLCTSGLPIFMSFPHFYKADVDVKTAISGLKSGGENHESYFNIHPTSGFVISGDLRLQMNVQVEKSPDFHQLAMFKDNVMLPIAWIEEKVESELEEIENIVTTTTPAAETILKIAFLSIAIIALIVIVTLLCVKYRKKIQKFSKQNKEIPRDQRRRID